MIPLVYLIWSPHTQVWSNHAQSAKHLHLPLIINNYFRSVLKKCDKDKKVLPQILDLLPNLTSHTHGRTNSNRNTSLDWYSFAKSICYTVRFSTYVWLCQHNLLGFLAKCFLPNVGKQFNFQKYVDRIIKWLFHPYANQEIHCSNQSKPSAKRIPWYDLATKSYAKPYQGYHLACNFHSQIIPWVWLVGGHDWSFV